MFYLLEVYALVIASVALPFVALYLLVAVSRAGIGYCATLARQFGCRKNPRVVMSAYKILTLGGPR